MVNKGLTQEEACNIMHPVCRELFDLTEGGHLQFISGSYNESNGLYKINLKSSHVPMLSLHLGESRTASVTLNIVRVK